MICTREGCERPVTQLAHGRPRKYCDDTCRIAVAKGAPVKSSSSWWTNPQTFYDNARKRFPETGAAVVERGKTFIGGSDGPTMGSRLSQGRGPR